MRTTVVVLILSCALLTGACVPPTATVSVADASSPTPTIAPSATPLPAPATAESLQPTAQTALDVPSTAVADVTAQPTPEAAPAVEETPLPEAEDAALLALGADLYRRQACGVCHKLSAIGSEGTFGPPHDNLAAIAAQRLQEERYHGAATTAEEYIRESIVDPLAFLVEGYQITRFPMPIFTNLSPQEVDALVYLLLHN